MGKTEQLTDERVEAAGLALDAIELLFHLRLSLFAGQLECDAEPRKRRAQLMRDIAQEQLLRIDQRLEAVGHLVEVVDETPELIATLTIGFALGPLGAGLHIAGRELPRGFT